MRLLPQQTLPDGRNALHSSIIDVFNEFGVQIMSPNFVDAAKGGGSGTAGSLVRRPRPSRRRSLRNKG